MFGSTPDKVNLVTLSLVTKFAILVKFTSEAPANLVNRPPTADRRPPTGERVNAKISSINNETRVKTSKKSIKISKKSPFRTSREKREKRERKVRWSSGEEESDRTKKSDGSNNRRGQEIVVKGDPGGREVRRQSTRKNSGARLVYMVPGTAPKNMVPGSTNAFSPRF